jgi:hypothetical protein
MRKIRQQIKREYKEIEFKKSFQTQFSTQKIDILNRVIRFRAKFSEAQKQGFYENENVFSLYRSTYKRSNCWGLE